MHINKKLKLRSVAGENIFIMPAEGNTSDLTKVVGLNSSALELYNHFLDRDFNVDDVAQALVDSYEVDLATATADAAKWVATMKEHHLIEE